MQRSRELVMLVLICAGIAFGVWQYRAWRQQQVLVRESVSQQARSVMNALLGAIQSHRRPERFFDTQFRGLLDGLVSAPDVLAVMVSDETGRLTLSSGDEAALSVMQGQSPGAGWELRGFVLVEQFTLQPASATEMRGPGRGMGRRRSDELSDDLIMEGATLTASLMLDRERSDQILRGVAWSYTLTTAAGALVLVGLAFAWRSSLQLVEERGRADLLDTEARHYRDMSQAAAGLAHETRNPLGIVRGWAERLGEAGLNDDDRRARSQSVVEECDRITARINQFLAFARPVKPNLAAVPLRELVDELSMLLQPDLDGAEVTLALDDVKPDVCVEADPELLRQALFNLLQNAVQSSSPGSVVDVRLTYRSDDAGRLEVRDRGRGVSAEDKTLLFSPYFTTRPEGTGLGLAIVRRIATAHGWWVDYTDRPGGGAVFFLKGLGCARTDDSDRR